MLHASTLCLNSKCFLLIFNTARCDLEHIIMVNRLGHTTAVISIFLFFFTLLTKCDSIFSGQGAAVAPKAQARRHACHRRVHCTGYAGSIQYNIDPIRVFSTTQKVYLTRCHKSSKRHLFYSYTYSYLGAKVRVSSAQFLCVKIAYALCDTNSNVCVPCIFVRLRDMTRFRCY